MKKYEIFNTTKFEKICKTKTGKCAKMNPSYEYLGDMKVYGPKRMHALMVEAQSYREQGFSIWKFLKFSMLLLFTT